MTDVRKQTVIVLCLATGIGIPTTLMAQEAGISQTQKMEAVRTDTLPVKWTLQTCIDYAMQQNIDIRKNRIMAESSGIDVKTARSALFPSLNASVSQRIVNRPNSETGTIISGDNITSSESKTSYNGTYGIDMSWTLYQGGRRLNDLKQEKLNQRIAELAVSESENSIQESIAQTYIQILYAAEAVKVNELTLETSQAQYERGKELFAAGSLSKADLAQLESQVSSDKYQVVVAETTLSDYRLQLKQLLELDGAMEMVLDMPVLGDENILTPLPSTDEVYRSALVTRPEIEAGRLHIDAAELDIKMARAGYIPSISLSAGIGSTNANGNDFSFTEQIKQNWNNSVGLTLSIPIFDNRQTKSSIQRAKLDKQTRALELLDEQKTLYRTIENLWQDARSQQQRYAAAVEQLRYTQTSFDLVNEQFTLGMKNVVELLTEKNNLLNAQQEMLQAKYMVLLDIQQLKFYQGEPMTL